MTADWKVVLQGADVDTLNRLLVGILRSRLPWFPVGVHGIVYKVPRALVRDYLRELIKAREVWVPSKVIQ